MRLITTLSGPRTRLQFTHKSNPNVKKWEKSKPTQIRNKTTSMS